MIFLSSFKKQKVKCETQLKGYIEYNYKQARVYKLANVDSVLSGGLTVAKGFHPSLLNKLKEYKIDSKLIDEVVASKQKALVEYDKMIKRINVEKQKRKREEDVELFKEAVLELGRGELIL